MSNQIVARSSGDSFTMEERKKILSQYHNGHASFMEKLQATGVDASNPSNSNLVMRVLFEEIFRSIDNLTTNEVIFTDKEELRDASALSMKRIDALTETIKMMQAQQAIAQRGGVGVDVDSPIMKVVYLHFLEKTKMAMDKVKIPKEVQDHFLIMFQSVLGDWRRDLKIRIAEELNRIGVADGEKART